MSEKSKSKSVKKNSPTRRRVEFSVINTPGRQVSVAGSFNNWDPEAKVLKDRNGDGIYRGIVMLEPGEYEYKFVVDGEWLLDEANPGFYPNDFGTLNSTLEVK